MSLPHHREKWNQCQLIPLLSDTVHRALAVGRNCTARVDCGTQRLVTIQQEGRS